MSTTVISEYFPSLYCETLHASTEINVLCRDRLKEQQTNLIPSICFYNGCFAPIHAGHLNVLEEAQRYINNLGTHELLGAYISPAHAGYVASKLCAEDRFGTGHRLAMIQLAINKFDWVMIDLFEIFQPHSIALSTIMENFASRVHSSLPNGKQIEIFWLQGENKLFYTVPEKLLQLGYHCLYVINCGLNENNSSKIQTQTYSSYSERFHLIRSKNLNLSSTAIRNCSHNPSVTYEQLQLCTQIESITSYILQHHLWNANTSGLPSAISSHSVRPYEIADFTPELLSQLLFTRSNDSIRVISLQKEQAGIGLGWGGPIYRLYNIQYSTANAENLPRSMILKLSTGNWNSELATMEADFYLKLASRISHVEIPRCYYAARYSHTSQETVLLLEDLTLSTRHLYQQKIIEDSTIFSLITMIASLHAEFFEHPMLKQKEFQWLPSLNSKITDLSKMFSERMSNQSYVQSFQSKLSDMAYQYLTTLYTYITKLFDILSNQNYTLCHGDFWITNILVYLNDSNRFVLLDWQTCSRMNGLIEIAFILRLFGSERARLLESKALEFYHKTLVKYGVSQYDATAIQNDYYTLALPFIFIRFYCWNNQNICNIDQLCSILEDIVMYKTKIDSKQQSFIPDNQDGSANLFTEKSIILSNATISLHYS